MAIHYLKTFFLQAERAYLNAQKQPPQIEDASIIKKFDSCQQFLNRLDMDDTIKKRRVGDSTERIIQKRKNYYAEHGIRPSVCLDFLKQITIRHVSSRAHYLIPPELQADCSKRKSLYAPAYFVEQIQADHQHHHKNPTDTIYSWSQTAIQQFGWWNTHICASDYVFRKPGGVYCLL